MRRRLVCGFGVLLIAAGLRAQSEDLGRIDFPTSGSPEAQKHFLRGALLLHSFEFDDAAEEFRQAQKIEPGFAMACWGEAMTFNHPLWMEQDPKAARKALEKLGPTKEARQAKAATKREHGRTRQVTHKHLPQVSTVAASRLSRSSLVLTIHRCNWG